MATNLSRADHADRLALYKLRYSDTKIAKLRGVTREAIGKWRKHYGLPAWYEVGRPRTGRVDIPAHVEERRMARYRLGWSDQKVADAEGVSVKRISSWRRVRGLVGNKGARLFQPVSHVSLDADLGEAGFNRHALIADDAAAAWLEQQGATVF